MLPPVEKAEIAEQLYGEGVAHFKRADFRRVRRAFAQHLVFAGRSDLLTRRNTNGAPNAVRYHEFDSAFTNFLRQKVAEWDNGTVPLPAFLRTHASPTDLAGGRRYSMLVLVSQFIHNSDRFVECDMADHLYQTALNAGIRAEVFFTDRISYPTLNLDPAKTNEDLRKLREKVATMRPDVIFFDANYVGDGTSFNRDHLARLKAEFGVKSVGFIGDAWGEVWIPVADYWGETADLITHFAPGGYVEQRSRFKEKLVCVPYPVNRKNFFPQVTRTLDLSFFGSYGSYLRPFWLTRAIKAASAHGVRSNLHPHERSSDCPNMAEYGAIMRNSRMVLNCSSRHGEVKMMTGRVWQALHAGCLLLEEDNDATRHFFVPFVHYVPYQNARQLGHLIEFFHRHPDEAERIGKRASEFCTRFYSETSSWGRVLSRL